MTDISRLIEKGAAGEDLTHGDVAMLLGARDEGACRELDAAADELKRMLWGERVTYVINLNLSWTNVCLQHCGFCNFRRGEGDRDAYRMSLYDVVELPHNN